MIPTPSYAGAPSQQPKVQPQLQPQLSGMQPQLQPQLPAMQPQLPEMPPHLQPFLPAMQCIQTPDNSFWVAKNVNQHLRNLRDTVDLAKALYVLLLCVISFLLCMRSLVHILTWVDTCKASISFLICLHCYN